MRKIAFPIRLLSVSITLALLMGVLTVGLYFHGTEAHAAAAIVPHNIVVRPDVTRAASDDQSTLFGCQAPGVQLRCYGPTQMRNAYDILPVLHSGITGAGQTIVIIDAYQSPTIQQDLATFDQTFGLPNPSFHIIAPYGLTPWNPNDPNQVGWSEEISLDVQWSHAIAPGAAIDLVLAKTNADTDLQNVIQYAVDNNLGSVMSMSFGEAEQCMDPQLMAEQDQTFYEATQKGITLFASSGDDGSAQVACSGTGYIEAVSTPASDPNVTAVGGTYLNANPINGKYQGEEAWNENDEVDGSSITGASGGGFSVIYPRPSYQNGYNKSSSMRGVPDIAYNASVDSGVLVYLGEVSPAGFYIFGGTSAGSPQMAAELALVNQEYGRQGNINPELYDGFASANYAQYFHDITVGTNVLETLGQAGYSCKVGWDPVTGLGSLILGNTFGISTSGQSYKW